jgi:hypothetical protein
MVDQFSLAIGTPNEPLIYPVFLRSDNPTKDAVIKILLSQPNNVKYLQILKILNPPTSSFPTTSRLTAYVPTTSSGPTPQYIVDKFSAMLGTVQEPDILLKFRGLDNSTKDAVIKILLSQPSNKNYLTILNILNNNPAIPRVSGGRSTKSKKRTRKVSSRRHRR